MLKLFKERKMRFRLLFLSTVFFAVSMSSIAQHKGHATKEPVSPLTFQGILSQTLSDSLLSDYKMEASVMTIAPGGMDTVSHRHDCELFGYVLEGSVEIALVTKDPKTYKRVRCFMNVVIFYTRSQKMAVQVNPLECSWFLS